LFICHALCLKLSAIIFDYKVVVVIFGVTKLEQYSASCCWDEYNEGLTDFVPECGYGILLGRKPGIRNNQK
jgi:hypothetical protein